LTALAGTMTDVDQLLSVLRGATKRIAGDKKHVAVAYSGGLDSSIMVALVKELVSPTGYTCAVKGSFDDKHVAEAARLDGIETMVIHLTDEDLVRYIVRSAGVLGTVSPVTISYTIPVLCALDNSKEDLLMVGSGADELFGGYAKYQAHTDPEGAMSADLVKTLAEEQLLQAEAGRLGKSIGFPFTDEAVIMAALSIPVERKMDVSGRKLILRDVGRSLVPHSADRPKKAAQYSSGVMKEMEKMAKEERLDLHDWTAAVCSRQSH
jgi:asparagine synthase (glutamine-hydrolysing)